jgi:hypothetical protein
MPNDVLRLFCLLALSLSFRAHAMTPTIEFYRASTLLVETIQPVRLDWKVKDAVRVDVYDGFRNTTYPNLGNQNYIEVWPEKTARYILYAYGSAGEVQAREITIEWPPLTIESFQASVLSITQRQPVRLSWKVRGATRVDVYDGFKNTTYTALGNQNYIEVWPETTASYRLYAYGQGQTLTRDITIEVQSWKPAISWYTASTQAIPFPRPVTIYWQVQNAASVLIRDNTTGQIYQGLAAYGNIEVLPQRTTTYTLQVVGIRGGEVFQNLTINVAQPMP